LTEEKENQRICPVCDTPISPTDRVCSGCGTELEMFIELKTVDAGAESASSTEDAEPAPDTPAATAPTPDPAPEPKKEEPKEFDDKATLSVAEALINDIEKMAPGQSKPVETTTEAASPEPAKPDTATISPEAPAAPSPEPTAPAPPSVTEQAPEPPKPAEGEDTGSGEESSSFIEKMRQMRNEEEAAKAAAESTTTEAPVEPPQPVAESPQPAVTPSEVQPTTPEQNAPEPAPAGPATEIIEPEKTPVPEVTPSATPPSPEPEIVEPEIEKPPEPSVPEPVATPTPQVEAETMTAPEKTETDIKLECPACNKPVTETMTRCPHCGVEFEEEEETEIPGTAPPTPTVQATPPPPAPATPEIPKEPVAEKPIAATIPPEPAPAEKKPEKELFKELTGLVGATKPLIHEANLLHLDINEPKGLIDRAILAGKSKDFTKAIELVKESKDKIENTIKTGLTVKLNGIHTKVAELEKRGANLTAVKPLVNSFESNLKEEKYDEAIKGLKEIETELNKSGKMDRTSRAIGTMEEILALCTEVEIALPQNAVNSIETAKSEEAAGKKNEAMAHLQEARKAILSTLPGDLKQKMAAMKKPMLEAKMLGLDISNAINLIKATNAAMKRQDYMTVLRNLAQVQKELKVE